MEEHPTNIPLGRRSEVPAAPVTLRPASERKAGGRRPMTAVRRWARDTFSKEQLITSLRSLVWVAPLTVLIWIYAEREQVETKAAQFQIEVRSGAPGQVARMADARGSTVTATVRGPRAKVGLAVDALQSGLPVQVYVGGGRKPGFHDVELLPLIAGDPRLGANTVVACEPKILHVEVDTVQEDLAEVRFSPEIARLLNGPAVFEPPKVKISAPSMALQKAVKDGLFAEVTDLPADMRSPGRHGPVSVRIKLPEAAGPEATLRQSNVLATFDVREADERAVINSVPVKMVSTPKTADDYRVTSYAPEFHLNVPVYGSPEKIQKLKNNELLPLPEARFSLTNTATAAGKGKQKLEYLLPEGIYIREEDKQEVTFELARRDASQ